MDGAPGPLLDTRSPNMAEIFKMQESDNERAEEIATTRSYRNEQHEECAPMS